VAELTLEQQRALALARARVRAQGAGPVDAVARNVGEPFNRGLAATLQAPTDLINAVLRGAASAGQFPSRTVVADPNMRASMIAEFGLNPDQFQSPEPFQIPADVEGGFRQMGLTAPPEEQKTGLIPRASEILGGSVVPAAGLATRGTQVARSLAPAATRSPLQQAAATTAQRPVASGAADIAASAMSATGGTVASQFTDDPTLIALGELAGGFSPVLVSLTPTAQLAGRGARFAADKLRKTFIPFTESGAEVRAAERLQGLTANPRQAAAQIGSSPELPPARQTGETRLVALENYVRAGDPKIDRQVSDQLQAARQEILSQADFGGDPRRAIQMLEVAAKQAGEQAQAAVAALGPNASPREISRVARRSVDNALAAARADERRLWRSIDDTAQTDLASSRESLSGLLAQRSKFDNPEDVPGWLIKALSDKDLPDDVMEQLAKSGFLDSNGNVPPAMREALGSGEAITLKDAQALRSRVLTEIRAERAQAAPNRRKIAILSEVEESLLDDMGRVDAEGVDRARAFSRAVNDKFTRGPVGRLMGHERADGSAVSEEDTLDAIVFGNRPATAVQQFIETNSEAPGQVLNFIKARYLESVAPRGEFDAGAHERFVANLRKKGLFETFPELEGQLNAAQSASNRARALQVDESQINTVRQRTGQSRAALFLQSDNPDEAFDLVLRSNNPAAATRSMVSRVGGDELALNGLKTSFAGSLIRSSTMPDGTISGQKFGKLIDEYSTTAQALRMTNGEVQRLRTVANKFRQANAEGAGVNALLNDEPAALIDFLVRIQGARAGASLADGFPGGQIQTAHEGARRMHQMLTRLTKGKAGELVEAAITDPELMKALLTRGTAAPPQIDRAMRIVDTWLVGQQMTQEN